MSAAHYRKLKGMGEGSACGSRYKRERKGGVRGCQGALGELSGVREARCVSRHVSLVSGGVRRRPVRL